MVVSWFRFVLKLSGSMLSMMLLVVSCWYVVILNVFDIRLWCDMMMFFGLLVELDV